MAVPPLLVDAVQLTGALAFWKLVAITDDGAPGAPFVNAVDGARGADVVDQALDPVALVAFTWNS